MTIKRYGWKVTGPRFTTSYGFTWDVTGKPNISNYDVDRTSSDVCPSRPGDGLTVMADTVTPLSFWMIAGVVASPTWLLRVSWSPKDELGISGHKVRVGGPVVVEGVWNIGELIPLAEELPVQTLKHLEMKSVTVTASRSLTASECSIGMLELQTGVAQLARCGVDRVSAHDSVIHGSQSNFSQVLVTGSRATLLDGNYDLVTVTDSCDVHIDGDAKVTRLHLVGGATARLSPEAIVASCDNPEAITKENKHDNHPG